MDSHVIPLYSSAHYILNPIDTHNYNTIAIPNPLLLVYSYPVRILESRHGKVHIVNYLADLQLGPGVRLTRIYRPLEFQIIFTQPGQNSLPKSKWTNPLLKKHDINKRHTQFNNMCVTQNSKNLPKIIIFILIIGRTT